MVGLTEKSVRIVAVHIQSTTNTIMTGYAIVAENTSLVFDRQVIREAAKSMD